MVLVASNAGAAVITQSTTFPHTPVSALTLNSFDPTLGTLNHVELTLSGQIVITVDTPPFLTGPFGTPTPYQFSVLLQQGFQGQGSFDVSFLFDALYLNLVGQATGTGGVVLFPLPFLFSVGFDATTDLTGISTPLFIGPDVVPPVSGRREDFLSVIPGFSTPLLAVHRLTPLFVSTTGSAVSPFIGPSADFNAALLYDYTPAVTVSEPASTTLLALGLALVAARRKNA
jgi:hypothetical protein